jgi:hypothetical protein
MLILLGLSWVEYGCEEPFSGKKLDLKKFLENCFLVLTACG